MWMARQGDVLTIRLPNGCDVSNLKEIPRESGDVVLAHGEATGHKHRFRSETTSMHELGVSLGVSTGKVTGARKLLASLPDIPIDGLVIGVLDAKEADSLVHEEHSTIPHEAGQYVALRQRTYTPQAVVRMAD